jgi:hypothetical protein
MAGSSGLAAYSSTDKAGDSLLCLANIPISQAQIGDSRSSPRAAAASTTSVTLGLSLSSAAHITACVSSKIGFIRSPLDVDRADEIAFPQDHTFQATAKACTLGLCRNEGRDRLPVFGDYNFCSQPLDLIHELETPGFEFGRADFSRLKHQERNL